MNDKRVENVSLNYFTYSPEQTQGSPKISLNAFPSSKNGEIFISNTEALKLANYLLEAVSSGLYVGMTTIIKEN